MIGYKSIESLEENPKELIFLLNILATSLLLFIVIWPQYNGMIFGNDDWVATYTAYEHSQLKPVPLLEAIKNRWNGSMNKSHFRIFDLLGGYLSNPESRDARFSLLLHIPALLLIFLVMFNILKLLSPDYRITFPIAVSLMALHTSTSLSLWQPDTISQTWSGVAGVCLGMCLWQGIELAIGNKIPWKPIFCLFFICFFGMITKESFIGWCAGSVLIITIILFIHKIKGKYSSITPFFLLIMPVVITPLSYLSLRVWCGPFGNYFSQEQGRYQASFGLSLLKNLILSFLGFFSVGPTYAIRALDTMYFYRFLPFIGIFAALIIVVSPIFLTRVIGIKDVSGISWGKAVLFAVFSFLGVSATLPTKQISELYMMGPNVGFALLISLSIVGTWRMFNAVSKVRNNYSQRTSFAIFFLSIALLVSIGTVALISKARQISITWENGSKLYNNIVRLQNEIYPNQKTTNIYIKDNCFEGRVYSQVILPPSDMVNIWLTENMLNQLHPERKISILRGQPQAPLSNHYLIIGCSEYQKRPGW